MIKFIYSSKPFVLKKTFKFFNIKGSEEAGIVDPGAKYWVISRNLIFLLLKQAYWLFLLTVNMFLQACN